MRIEVIQRPMETNPLAGKLLETKKEIPPKRARL